MYNHIRLASVVSLVLALLFSGGCYNSVLGSFQFVSAQDEPYNVILMIGDGMGWEHIELGKLVEFGALGNLSMQQASLHLNVTTHNADSRTTDSAAAATAMATGRKTDNGKISVLPDGEPIDTILEIAQANGKSTGLVATTLLQHATPAAFMTHVENRNNYSEITRQLVEEVGVDVLLGGGREYFSDSQLLAMEDAGYSIVYNRSDLLSISSGSLLGLFAEQYLEYEEHRIFDTTPSLAEMTSKSLELLSQDSDGFFLMVEGSKIDYAAHDHDRAGVALEVIAFHEAVSVAIEYMQGHSNTILIVTADHETGGLTIAGDTLSDDLPNSALNEEQRRTLRTSRAVNITAFWSTTAHTNTTVPLFAFGDIFDEQVNGDVIDNTDIFFEMINFFSKDSAFRTDWNPENPPEFFTLMILTGSAIVALVVLVVLWRRKQ
ncbi:MAG: alkaline phosphatase [Candidatus Thorarchaeota archaeon]